ncbi:ClpP/crotonase-like domain-containing protein [Melampsora americana]|nr:ClpP/crotonase-like domain-containing protein [Melampsora americana]
MVLIHAGYSIFMRRTLKQAVFKNCISSRALSSSTQDVYLEHVSSNPELRGLTFLNLNRPTARNAISSKLLSELSEALETVRFDGTRVLVLKSSSTGSFCAGADLKERQHMSKLEVSKFLHELRKVFHDLENIPMPTIAAIDGPALGGGLELALACDLRVAGPGASKIGLTETRLGIIPGAGGTQRVSRLLGLSKAKDLIFGAKMLNAQQAHDLGLVDYISEGGISATELAVKVAQGILPNGPVAIQAAKLSINRSIEVDLQTGLDFERQCYETVLRSQDRLEGLSAFNEKRKPHFTGE